MRTHTKSLPYTATTMDEDAMIKELLSNYQSMVSRILEKLEPLDKLKNEEIDVQFFD